MPLIASLIRYAFERSELARLEAAHGKSGAREAARTEEYHRKAAHDALIQLVTRRFESDKVCDALLYVLGGCEGHPFLPSFEFKAPRTEDDQLTMELLFGSTPSTTAPAAAAAAAATSPTSATTATSAQAEAGPSGAPLAAAGHAKPLVAPKGAQLPRGVDRRRGQGEGFMAGLSLGVYLVTRIASHNAAGFWATVLFAPSALGTMYVPTMAGDEFAMILAASDYVGWYKCPNGHPYSVGNCTRPMQLARCPACGAPIGGTNHEDVAGVTRLGVRDELVRKVNGPASDSARDNPNTKKGYHRDDLLGGAKSNMSDIVPRAAEATTRVLRIFMHTLLHLHGSTTERWTALHDVLKPPELRPSDADASKGAAKRVERAVRSYLEDQILSDWEGLQEMYGLDEEQVMLALVLVAARMHQVSSTLKGFATEAARSSFECVFEWRCVQPIFGANVVATVLAVQREIDPAGDVEACRNAFGVLWPAISDEEAELEKRSKEPPQEEDATAASKALTKALLSTQRLAWLWNPAPDASLRLFKLEFGSSVWLAKQFPLIAALLKHERRLPLIGSVADVLRWHAVLFRALRHGLRREEAAELSNAQAIERLPRDQQPEAHNVLEAFCESFNRSFVLVERLFECQANPYLYEADEGEVRIDLSGAGGRTGEPQRMSPETSVLFSLPSMVAGAQDADGLCTIQLCNVLSAAHNELMDVLLASSANLMPRAARGTDTALPTISYLSSAEVMREQLLSYSSTRDLLPLLAAHRRDGAHHGAGPAEGVNEEEEEEEGKDEAKGKGKGKGEGKGEGKTNPALPLSSFDLHAIEASLAHSVLGRAAQLVVHVHHFEYQGNLLRTGKMSMLKERVPQRPLPPALLQTLCVELDTAHQQQALLGLLEQAVAFLSALGQESSSEQPLREYVLHTLLVPDEVWRQASSHSVEQHVCLCHVQSLFVALEEGQPDALERVHPKYREPLPAGLAKMLRADVRLRRSVLLPVLHEFLTTQLVEGSWPADASLKQYLTFTDPDLEDAEWYAGAFPEQLSLCHAVALHAALTAADESER